MTTIVQYVADGERHNFQAADMPIALGLAQDGGVVVAKPAEAAPVAWFGYDQGQIFVQPEPGSADVRLNGDPLQDSAWLTAGDALQVAATSIAVSHESGLMVLTHTRRGPTLVPPKQPPSDAMAPTPVPRRKGGSWRRNLGLVVFAVLVLIADASNVSNATTVLACQLFFWARLVHLLSYTFAIPWVRTVAFVAGFGCQMALVLQLI